MLIEQSVAADIVENHSDELKTETLQSLVAMVNTDYKESVSYGELAECQHNIYLATKEIENSLECKVVIDMDNGVIVLEDKE